MYMKGIHNAVVDAMLWLEYNSKLNTTNEYTHAALGVSSGEMSMQKWKSLVQDWQWYNECNASTQTHSVPTTIVFANCSEEDKIYPLTTAEIAEAQWADPTLKHLFKRNAGTDKGLEIKLIENTTCFCKDGWLLNFKPVQVRAVKWYHHYLQHPWYTRLEEIMSAVIYWKGIHTTIW